MANETGQQVRVFAAKPGDLNSTRDKTDLRPPQIQWDVDL